MVLHGSVGTADPTVMLVMAAVLSMLERRTMALVHQRDGPTALGVVSMQQYYIISSRSAVQQQGPFPLAKEYIHILVYTLVRGTSGYPSGVPGTPSRGTVRRIYTPHCHPRGGSALYIGRYMRPAAHVYGPRAHTSICMGAPCAPRMSYIYALAVPLPALFPDPLLH